MSDTRLDWPELQAATFVQVLAGFDLTPGAGAPPRIDKNTALTVVRGIAMALEMPDVSLMLRLAKSLKLDEWREPPEWLSTELDIPDQGSGWYAVLVEDGEEDELEAAFYDGASFGSSAPVLSWLNHRADSRLEALILAERFPIEL
jgi:hypothetical protein